MSTGFKIVLMISIPCVLGIEILSDKIVPVLFGDSFAEAVITLRILAPLILIFSVAYFLGHIILIATNNESKILSATITGAVLNFSMNLMLIPVMKQNGAAIASVAAEFIITVILIAYSHKYYRLSVNRRFICSMAVASAVMSLVVFLTNRIDIGNIIGLIVSAVCGMITYFLLQILLKNDIVLMITGKLFGKKEIRG